MTRPFHTYVTREIPSVGLDLLMRAGSVETWQGDVPPPREELLARVDVLGRRGAVQDPLTKLEVGDVRMDVVERKCTRDGEAVALSPREFELLRIFLQEPGRTFSREEICERIWEREH